MKHAEFKFSIIPADDLEMQGAKSSAGSGRNEFLILLVRTDILTLFFKKSCLKIPNPTRPNGIFTRLGRVDVDFFLPLSRHTLT